MNTTAFYYQVVGLTILSELAQPNWQQIAPVHEVDVYIQYTDQFPRVEQVVLDKGYFQMNETEYCIDIGGVAKFMVVSGKRILIQADAKAQKELILQYLQSRIFSVLLFQRTIIPLAASAILLNKKCVVFTGASAYATKLLPAWYQQEHQALLSAYLTPIAPKGQTYTGFSYSNDKPIYTEKTTHAINTLIAFESVNRDSNVVEVEQVQGIEKFTLLKDNVYYKEALLALDSTALFYQFVPLLQQTTFYKICVPKEDFDFYQLIEKINQVIYDH